MLRDDVAEIKRQARRIASIADELRQGSNWHTSEGTMTEEEMVMALDYASYRYNRDFGCSAEKLASNYAFGDRAPILEARYQREQQRKAVK